MSVDLFVAGWYQPPGESGGTTNWL